MTSKPYWTTKQESIFEHCLDVIQERNPSRLTFELIETDANSLSTLKTIFNSEAEMQINFVKYWAWKETWEINEVLIKIKNPFRRLFTLMKWGFKNNRYIRVHPYLLRMQWPDEAKEEMGSINRRKHEFLIELFTDRGLSKSEAIVKARSILPFYYGWARDKDDQVRSDIDKFAVLSIYKTMLFPELFKGEKASINEL